MVDGIRLAAALAILGVAAGARANSVSNEVFVNGAQTTDANPRSTVFTDALNANFDLGTDWTVSGGLSLTLEGATQAATRAQFGESGSAILLFTGGLDWSATENLTLGATLAGSPASTQFVGTPITLGTVLTADAQVRSRTSQLSGGIDASWDTLGLSDLEWSFDLGIDLSHYDIDQSIPRVRTASGTLTSQQLEQRVNAYCGSNPQIPNCGRNLLDALKGTPVTLDFARLSAGATATLFRDTDVAMLGDWYVYVQDPAQVGYFGLASLGQGAGLPIAPLRYLVRPEILHRFGDFSAKLWLQAGEYAAGTGQNTAAVGLKLQYRFTKAFRAWITGSGQRDVDAGQNVTRSGTVSLGAGYRW
ncbi:MAG: hypothetical protein ACXWLR_02490 [Myxococcales bacterium]